MAGQQNFNTALQKIFSGGIVFADGLGLESGAAGVEAGRKHASVVEDEEVIRSKQVGEIAELAIMQYARALDVQQARGGAVGQRLLRDEGVGEIEVEVGDLHALRI